MMVGLTQQKGGCAKSTTAVHLAHWLQRRGHRVHLVDLDPQGTSSFWLQASDIDLPFTFLAADSDVVLEQLPALATGCDYLVVDGPAGLSDATRAVLLLADLALIPVQPSGADVRSAVDAVRLVHQARRIRGGQPDARLFISRAAKGTRLLAEARSVLNQLEGIPLLNTAITQRQVVADAFGQAVTVLTAETGPGLEAANEFNQLFTELLPDA
jgi:chromosome partitioning protein